MAWRWTARRLGVSAFLIFHLSATACWVLPFCPIKQRVFGSLSYYMFPVGTWQCWSMFSPNPPTDIFTLEAVAVDAQGMQHGFLFPKIADYSLWGGLPRYRHPKFAANLLVDEFAPARCFAARHAVRKLELPADAFPVKVHLVYMVRTIPPPGSPPEELPSPPTPVTFASFQFQNPGEVRP